MNFSLQNTTTIRSHGAGFLSFQWRLRKNDIYVNFVYLLINNLTVIFCLGSQTMEITSLLHSSRNIFQLYLRLYIVRGCMHNVSTFTYHASQLIRKCVIFVLETVFSASKCLASISKDEPAGMLAWQPGGWLLQTATTPYRFAVFLNDFINIKLIYYKC